MASVDGRLAAARARLEAAGLSPADAALDADVLARHALGWDRASLISRGRDAEPHGFDSTFEGLVSRRAHREPIAQILGHREFWGLDFEVTPDVLTPRPETEIIVEEALAFSRDRPVRYVIDVGTGSGCLAVSIAHELLNVTVTAIDLSAAALAVAKRNAARHAVDHRITFRDADLFAGSGPPADLVVCNPPYVPEADAGDLPPEVLRYEPHLALFGGPTGLEFMRRLFAKAPDHLADQGRLVVEFGFGQSESVVRLAETGGWRVIRVRKDLQGIPRTLVLSRPEPEGDSDG
jgi:release factor glutamine methyltransferase